MAQRGWSSVRGEEWRVQSDMACGQGRGAFYYPFYGVGTLARISERFLSKGVISSYLRFRSRTLTDLSETDWRGPSEKADKTVKRQFENLQQRRQEIKVV